MNFVYIAFTIAIAGGTITAFVSKDLSLRMVYYPLLASWLFGTALKIKKGLKKK